MNSRMVLVVGATLLTPLGALANEFTSLHPEAAHPDRTPHTQQVSPGPYTEFNKRVQEKLHQLGFDAGPVNGDFGSKTQAALAQFQLSVPLPASGQLDDQTLAALGVERDARASAGASGDASAGATPSQPAADADGLAQDRKLGGSCDALAGPEKERCVQQGGTVEASAKSSGGASAPVNLK